MFLSENRSSFQTTDAKRHQKNFFQKIGAVTPRLEKVDVPI
jgi:hypothetical protein